MKNTHYLKCFVSRSVRRFLRYFVILGITLLTISNGITAQDLVVLNSGDSLNCKITKVEDQKIWFTVRINREDFRQEVLDLWQVKDYQRSFFDTPMLFRQTKKEAFKADDLIVLNSGDSIVCEILSVKNQQIIFNIKYHDNHIQQEVLDLWKIKEYIRGHEENQGVAEVVSPSRVSSVQATRVSEPENPLFPYTAFRISFKGGWSYLIARTSDNVSDEMDQYMKELRSGLHLGLDAVYYFNESYGIGIAFSSFHTENELNNVEFYLENGNTITGTMGDDINISFIGLMFSQRSLIGHSNSKFIANVGLGSLNYRNDATILNRIDITGEAFGLYASLELDFRVDKNLSLGIGASYVGGTIRKVTYDDGTNSVTHDMGDNGDNVGRVDLSAGLRLHL